MKKSNFRVYYIFGFCLYALIAWMGLRPREVTILDGLLLLGVGIVGIYLLVWFMAFEETYHHNRKEEKDAERMEHD